MIATTRPFWLLVLLCPERNMGRLGCGVLPRTTPRVVVHAKKIQ
jgi:hypothetical protein